MFRKLLLFSVTIFVFTACSSYPDSAEGVAKAVCKEFKNADLEAMYDYMSEEAQKKMRSQKQLFINYFKAQEYKKLQEKIDCSKSSEQVALDDFTQKIYFTDSFYVKVKRINSEWKMVQ